MAKHSSAAYMTSGEQIAGVVFFVLYLLVLPLVSAPFFDLVQRLLGITLSASVRAMLYAYILFAVTVVIFHGYLAETTRRLVDGPGHAVQTLAMGLVGVYGLNELFYRLTKLALANRVNLNDGLLSADGNGAAGVTLLIVILLTPVVEETLFRGLVFGNLRGKGRILAYGVSCVLFALSRVWGLASGSSYDAAFWLRLAQYLAPGAVLCWSYDRSGTLWTPIGIHAAFNALHMLTGT